MVEKRLKQYEVVHEYAKDLFARKNKDYGDSFARYGLVGVITRINEKIDRCMTISKKSIVLVNDEALRDTLLDLHNYAAMALMLLDEKNNNDKE